MTREALESIFIGSAVLGSALLLLSSFGHGAHPRVRLPRIPLPRGHAGQADNATLVPIVLGSVAMFGIGGLFGVALGGDVTAQALLAFAAGAAGASLVVAMFGALGKAQGREPTSLRDLVGHRARVVVSIGRDVRGTVELRYDGSVQVLPASAESDIPRGQEVAVSAVNGMGVTVRALPPPP